MHWMRDLVSNKAGKFTPQAAMFAMSHLAALLEFDYSGEHKLTQARINRFIEKAHTIERSAEPSSSEFLL